MKLLKMEDKITYDLSKADLFKSVAQFEKEGVDKDFIKAYVTEVDRRRCNKIPLILSGISKETQLKFEDNNLLQLVLEELSKTHIGDDNLKMTTYLACLSALLKNPKLRISVAIKGNSSEGKDNLIKTCLKHIPNESWIFLTSGTQATIEDDINDKRIIAFSEVNANREVGANKYLTEVIKQKSEGGTSSIKKDKRTDNKTMRHETGEQASVLYATTETGADEELGTRFIEGTIKTDYQRIKKVNDKTCDIFSNMDLLLQDSSEEDSWLKNGLTAFFRREKQPTIVLPYAKFLKEQLEGQDIFDNNSARSQRDIKRLLSLTCAMTYLFQEQRKKVEHKGRLFIISEVDDLINTLNYSAEFFNQSYSGLDGRLTEVLKVMKELGESWIARDELQEKMGVSRNTIKEYCRTLAGEGLIEGISGRELNESEELNIYNKNKVYYKRCKKGVKKPIIKCEISKLKEFLITKVQQPTNTLFDKGNTKEKDVNLEGIKIVESMVAEEKIGLRGDNLDKIDTFFLTPSCDNNSGEDIPKEEEFDKSKIEVIKIR